MAKQIINVGTVPDDGTGDTLRVAFTKAKDNFDELYAAAENIVLDVSELTDEQNLLFDKNYDSLDNLPTIPSDISGLTDEQNLLFDGDYNNLDNLPTIATDISGLTDNSNLLIVKDHIELTNRLVTDPTSLVFFVKPPDTSSDEVFDEIDTNLILTRDATGIGGLGGGIYNKALETEWEAVESPLGTEWNADGWDNFDNVKLRFYEPLREMFRNRIGNNIVGAKLVMHDTINDKYYKIEFTQWQQGADHNGNFAYTRELIDTTPDVGIVYPDGSIQVSSPQPFTGFREIYLGDTSQYDIQPKDRGKYIEAFNTTIFIPNEETYVFPLGSFIFFVAENGPITLEARDEAIIYGPDGILTSSWVIPARTTATIIKTDANTWNITGRLLSFTGNVVGSNQTTLVDTSTNTINGTLTGPWNNPENSFAISGLGLSVATETSSFALSETGLSFAATANTDAIALSFNSSSGLSMSATGGAAVVFQGQFSAISDGIQWASTADINISSDGDANISSSNTSIVASDLVSIIAPNISIQVSSMPITSKGIEGNIQGQIAFDANYFYYCFANYTDGVSDIWKRISWSTDSW